MECWLRDQVVAREQRQLEPILVSLRLVSWLKKYLHEQVMDIEQPTNGTGWVFEYSWVFQRIWQDILLRWQWVRLHLGVFGIELFFADQGRSRYSHFWPRWPCLTPSIIKHPCQHNVMRDNTTEPFDEGPAQTGWGEKVAQLQGHQNCVSDDQRNVCWTQCKLSLFVEKTAVWLSQSTNYRCCALGHDFGKHITQRDVVWHVR